MSAITLQYHHAQTSHPKNAEHATQELYCSFLGLKEITKLEPLRGRGGFWIQIGSMQNHVSNEDDFGRTQAKAHLGHLVDDLEQWQSRLDCQGIQTIQDTELPGHVRFEFRNLFGNRVETIQVTNYKLDRQF